MADIQDQNEIFEARDTFNLSLDDTDVIKIVKRYKENSDKQRKKEELNDRVAINRNYFVGKQLPDEKEMESYEARYIDNLIYEGEASIKPIALSRIPELLITPGNDNAESRKVALRLSDVINDKIQSRQVAKELSLAFRHHPIYFIGALKARWDPESGKDGDYVFEAVHPDSLILDDLSKSGDVDKMRAIGHEYVLTLKEVIIRFPKKKSEVFKALGFDEVSGNKEANMATPITITEMWFTHYDSKVTEDEGVQWIRQELVTWTILNHGNGVVLDKMRDPNWDWEGEEQLFNYNGDINTLRQALVLGSGMEGLTTEKIYYNHLIRPTKPFYFLTYDQLGESAYDVTSRIEQVIKLQDNINKRGKQITEIGDRTKLKHVFSTDSGIKADDLEVMDLSDPDEHLLVSGKVNETHGAFAGDQPSAALFQEQEINRSRLFAKMGVNATTRGQVETDTATIAQIARESDFGRIDDLTEETINGAVEWMANWALQFIRLRYTEQHLVKLLGEDGSTIFEKIDRDLIEDGMEVRISTTGVDKIMAQRRALELAKLAMVDPLTFYEDLGVSQPEERAKRLMAFQTNPAAYMAEFIDHNGGTPEEMGANLNGQLQTDIQALMSGQMPQVPAELTPEYIEGISAFIQSPEFQQLGPDIQSLVISYAEQLAAQGGQTPPEGMPNMMQGEMTGLANE